MRLKNIECQLTQGQLTRYMRGDALSDTAIEQLESHLSECDDCTEYLDELKAELMPEEAEVEEEEPEESAPASPEPSTPQPPRFLVDAIRFKREKLDQAVRPVSTHAVIETTLEPAPAPKAYLKPLLYSLGLAAVMVGMTSVMRDPTKLFGERLESSLPTESPTSADTAKSGSTSATNVSETSATPKTTAGATPIDLDKPNAEDSTGSASAKPLDRPESAEATTTPVAKETGKPKHGQSVPRVANAKSAPATPQPKRTAPRKRTNTSTRQPASKARAPRNGIRIYDSTGNPVNH